MRQRELKLDATRLEIASGYDGLLRGAPEPVVVVAGYALGHAHKPETLFRAVWRAQPSGSLYPQVAQLSNVIGPGRAMVPHAALALLLVIGVEDDGGGGVGAVMGALERADEISIATDHVVSLTDLRADEMAWAMSRRVQVFVDGAGLEKKCPNDDYVGASAFVVRKKNDEQRAHLLSEDRLNDWTVLLTSKLRER